MKKIYKSTNLNKNQYDWLKEISGLTGVSIPELLKRIINFAYWNFDDCFKVYNIENPEMENPAGEV